MGGPLRVWMGGLILFWIGLLALAHAHRDDMPEAGLIFPALLTEPSQTETRRPAFDVTQGSVNYHIQPVYDYKLYGLVVSLHDASSWKDSMHRITGDRLNVIDLCVVWGPNIKSGVYADPDMHFSSGQYRCYFAYRNPKTGEKLDLPSLSNNHLLATTPELIEKIREVRVGDQVVFAGHLANYSHRHEGKPFLRGTSTTRLDRGDGACEIVFVEQFDILRTANPLWRTLYWLSLAGLIGSVAAWLMAWYFGDV